MTETLIQIFLMLLLPPLLFGIINRTKARFAGRTGAPLVQPYRDLLRLFRKQAVLSTTTTWIFRAAPVVSLVAVAAAGLFVPLGPLEAPLSFEGDLVLFAYLFALARFFTTAAALDAGSAFGGMGASREATFACLSEPALFFALVMLAMNARSLDMTALLHGPAANFSVELLAPLLLTATGLFVVLLAETCRIPVDDPNTHLELTMIHEAMVLDHGGPLFGLVTYAATLKLWILGAVLIHVLVPFSTGDRLADGGLFVLALLLLAVLVGGVESLMARLRLNRIRYLLVGALLFNAAGFILMVR